MKLWKSCFVALAVLLMVSGTGMAVQQDKTVNMAIFWLDGDIEPTSAWHGWTLTRIGVGENLIQIDENLQFKPGIAESWEQIDDTTTVFTIRDGVTFHNGAKADAAAVKASLERAISITDRKDMQPPIESITTDGKKLTIKTKRPYATLLNLLADPVFIIVDVKAADQAGDNFKFKPIATGPYKVDAFLPEKGINLSKYSGYWKGEPGVDKIIVKYISDGTTRTMALQSGELDFAPQISGADLEILEKDPKLKVLSGPNLRVFLLRPNFTHPWMQVPAFRKAIRYAIQKDVYAEKIAKGIAARGPFNNMLPFGLEGDDPYPYNPQKARELLDSAGIVDSNGDGIREFAGKNIELLFIYMANHGARAKNIATAMQSELKKVGIALNIQQMENYAEAQKQGKFDFLFERWTSAPTLDPQYFLEASFKTEARGNAGKYSNKDFDALLNELDHTLDKAKRNELGAKGSRMLMDDAAAIFLFYERGNVVHNKRIDGVYKFTSEIYYIDDRLKFSDK